MLKNGFSFRSCPLCGCWLKINPGFCELCQTDLREQFQPQAYFHYDFPSFFGWTWTDDQEGKRIGSTIKAMKGGWAKHFYNQLAFDFATIRLKSGLEKDLQLVPAPPSENGSDHALEWAKTLSKVFNVEMKSVLLRKTEKKQGLKRLKDRKKLEFSVKSEIDTEKVVVFVDDLITSGNTARAAYEALGKPTHYEVWTLACRPLKSLI